MNKDYHILLSKIVASATDTTWSQAFTILNLYIVISLQQNEIEESITAYGKEVLEKMQREFFAIDDKNLTTVKQAVANTIEIINPETSYSIVLATVVNDIIYIIIASDGQVLLRRGGKVGIIAKAEHGDISAFSGNLKHDDVIILETEDFSKMITPSYYDQILQNKTVSDISESLAPLTHEAHAHGTEAAIILQYHRPETDIDLDSPVPEEEPEKNDLREDNDEETNHADTKPLITLPRIVLPKLTIPFNRRTLGVGIALVLLIILIGTITADSLHKNTQQNSAKLSSILAPAQQDYTEGVDLENLNKPLALSTLMNAHAHLTNAKSTFAANPSSEQQLTDLLTKVDNEIIKLGGNPNLQKQSTIVFFDPAQSIGNVSFAVLVGTSLAAVNASNGKVALLNTNGSVKQTFSTNASGVIDATSEGNYIYLLTSNKVVQLDTSTNNTRTLTTTIPQDAQAIQTFTGNLYILDPQKQDVRKYVASSFNDSSYFAQSTTFSSPPISFAIDSDVYILLKNGQIKKFTRGSEDSFSLSGLSSPFGSKARIVTSASDTKLYVLDPTNGRLITLTKGGDESASLSNSIIRNATSFTIDEPNKTAYIVSNNKVYTLPL